MQGRSFSIQGRYRYGFNGKERDNEIAADNYDFGARIYDGRIGRFLSEDPKADLFPEISVFCFALNNCISHIDRNGESAENATAAPPIGNERFITTIRVRLVGGTIQLVNANEINNLQNTVNNLSRKLNRRKYYITVGVTETDQGNLNSQQGLLFIQSLLPAGSRLDVRFNIITKQPERAKDGSLFLSIAVRSYRLDRLVSRLEVAKNRRFSKNKGLSNIATDESKREKRINRKINKERTKLLNLDL